jgi:anti-anti-sigma factor
MMNSTALGVMIGAKKKLDAAGAEVRMCGLSSRMKSLVVVIQLTKWFNVHDTEKEAVEAFQKDGAGA